MRNTLRFSLLMGIGGLAAFGQVASDILPPQKRAATVDFARKLLEPAPALETAGATPLPNPFSLNLPESATPPPVSNPGAGADLAGRAGLEVLASKITPTGSVEIGGEPILLFGQKKLKVGDRLPIIFEGKPYELEISAIERTSFTLRLNGEEVTRPIKPVTKPKP
ncbi:MAG: hypothetical protein JF599_08205 [Verrucomicrobia bacterium]|nr:hypothetical protein [Verrucomicrobiota bacterium]